MSALSRMSLHLMTGVMVSTLGCSLIVSFDESKRPCGPDANGDKLGDCLDGYSCMVNQCVANGSVVRGGTCYVTAHCQGGDVCAVPGFICRQPCTWAFGNSNECDGANMVCVAATDSTNLPLGACVESDPSYAGSCQTTCPNPNACVLVKPGLGRCYTGCTLSCTTSDCTDSCVATNGDVPHSCQPAGLTPTLVCLPAASSGSARGQGAPCNFVDEPCDPGYGCIMPTDSQTGVCRAYCEVTGDVHCSSLGGTCQALTALGVDLGICE